MLNRLMQAVACLKMNARKPKGANRKQFTLLFVSSHGKSRALGFKGPALYTALALILALSVGLACLVSSYVDHRRQVAELQHIREIAGAQKEQMEILEKRLSELSDRIKQAELSEGLIRDMLTKEGLAPQNYETEAMVASISRLSLTLPSRSSATRSSRVQPGDLVDTLVSLTAAVSALEKKTAQVEKETATLQADAEHEVAYRRATPCLWPVRGRISSDFGRRRHPITRIWENHGGVDIAASYGAKIVAPADGRVKSAGYKYGYGYMITIDHGFGYQTLYAHCSRLAVRTGQAVCRGDVIGYVGQSGTATGPHLHYEIRVKGVQVDPAKFLP